MNGINFNEELTRCFDLASYRHLSRGLKGHEDWKAAREIITRYQDVRSACESEYREQFGTRVKEKLHELTASRGAPARKLEDRRFALEMNSTRAWSAPPLTTF